MKNYIFYVRIVAKTARTEKANETVKLELLTSIKEEDNSEEPDIDALIDTVTYPLEAIRLIQRLFQRLIHAVYFKIGLYRFLKKYPTLKKFNIILQLLLKEFSKL